MWDNGTKEGLGTLHFEEWFYFLISFVFHNKASFQDFQVTLALSFFHGNCVVVIPLTMRQFFPESFEITVKKSFYNSLKLGGLFRWALHDYITLLFTFTIILPKLLTVGNTGMYFSHYDLILNKLESLPAYSGNNILYLLRFKEFEIYTSL